MSFETTTPRSAQFSTLKGVEDIEYFDLRQTAKLIKERVELESEFWKAVIGNNKERVVAVDSQMKIIDARIQRWENTKSDKVR